MDQLVPWMVFFGHGDWKCVEGKSACEKWKQLLNEMGQSSIALTRYIVGPRRWGGFDKMDLSIKKGGKSTLRFITSF